MSQPKKSYSFYFNTSDWLASQAVKEMSKAERGVFICLLALAWERKNQLPASEERVRRLAEMSTTEWAESREILLDQFPLSECETYRFNRRLQLEVDKEEGKSKKASESAAARWECERNANASKKHANASKKNANASPKHMLGDAQEQEQVQGTTDVVPHEEAAAATPEPEAKKSPKELAALLAADNDLFEPSALPMLNELRLFVIVATRYGYADCDHAHYMQEIRATCEGKKMKVGVSTYEGFIKTYLKNEAASRLGLKKIGLTMQPKGKAENEPDYRLNQTAVARRRREQEEREQQMLSDNLARIAASDAKHLQITGRVTTPLPA